jgi:pyruvate dehydrogenase E2 component (dihydrolipoamide acetyltransferase)
MKTLKMPSLGADMEAGILLEWRVKPGDRVAHDDVIAVIETQKGAIDMEAFSDGTIRQLLIAEGDKVAVGTPIAQIDDEHGEQPEDNIDTPLSEPEPERLTPAHEPVSPQVPPVAERPERRVRSSPYARRLAKAQGVGLERVTGSGPQGAVVAADLKQPDLKQVDLKRESPAVGSPYDAEAMRRAIGAAMARSKREIPHYYLQTTVDLQAACDWLRDYNADKVPEQRLLMAALLYKATALALKRSPALNGFYEDEAFHPQPAINLGIAISIRGGGLIAPALLNADQLSLTEMMAALMDLTLRAREGGLRSGELSQATVTVSSMGDRGVEVVQGIIYPPQVALIGLGMPVTRPWVVDGTVMARQVLNITLAADHRVTDGRQGARFLNDLDKLLQHPEAL